MKIFVIESYSHDDDDMNREAAGFVMSKDAAEKAVASLNVLLKETKEARDKIYAFSLTLYNQQPKFQEMVKVPVWSPGLSEKDITPEMRKIREDIRQVNKHIASENVKIGTEYQKGVNVQIREYKDSLCLSPKVLANLDNYAESYYYYELEEMEISDEATL